MNKVIIVPTDFSGNAANAFRFAIEFAKKKKVTLLLLHVYSIVPSAPETPLEYILELQAQEEKRIIRHLKTMCERAKRQNIEATFVKKEGFAVPVILKTIKQEKPYMVIMGTKGASGIKELIMGSTTARVIEKAEYPVLAIPEKAVYKPVERIFYASDYKTSDMDALQKVVEIASPFDAWINFIHIADEEFTLEAEQEQMKMFSSNIRSMINYPKMLFKVIYGNQLIKSLDNYIREEQPDMLVIATHRHNLLGRIFGTSVTKKIALHTKIPLLALRDKPLVLSNKKINGK